MSIGTGRRLFMAAALGVWSAQTQNGERAKRLCLYRAATSALARARHCIASAKSRIDGALKIAHNRMAIAGAQSWRLLKQVFAQKQPWTLRSLAQSAARP